jgi:hypothetical protein
MQQDGLAQKNKNYVDMAVAATRLIVPKLIYASEYIAIQR